MFTEYMKIRKEPGCVFSMDLFKIYSKIILKGLENLPGFIISKHNLSNIWYADNSVDDRKKTERTPRKGNKKSRRTG